MKQELKTDVENRIILHLLQFNSVNNEFDSLLSNEIDWDYLLQMSEDHRVVPLLFKKLKSDYLDKIPEQILTKFQTRYQQIAAYNFARTTQLIKLVNLLQKQNLPVIAYKGMALAKFAYKDITLRQFTDIDLMIRKKDFFRVKDLFTQIGCRPAWELTENQEKAVLKYYYEYPFFYDETNTLIEVHWEFIESFFAFDFEMKNLWNRTKKITLYGKETPTLAAEDCLLVLCSHGSKHFWKRLSWICDVANLVETCEIDWGFVQNSARKIGSLRMVLLGLYLAKELLKIELPDEIDGQIFTDVETIRLGEMFKKGVFETEKEPLHWAEMAKIHLRMREKSTTKIKYLYRLFTTKLIDKLFMPMGRPR